MKRRLILGVGLLGLAVAADPDQAVRQPSNSASAVDDELTDGEVRKIDRVAGRLTLRHAEIKSLDMPPMTMVFQVRDPALLDGVQVGSRVRFRVRSQAGGFVVTALTVIRP